MSDYGSGHPIYDPGYGEFDSPSVEELARMVESGLACQDCFAQFTREHGEPVSCSHCVNQRIEMEVKEAVVRARHPEVNREAFRQRAKKRKENKNV